MGKSIFACPVCGFDGLFEKPWDGDLPSDEICPSCGIQFGYDDSTSEGIAARVLIHERWRASWTEAGRRWWSNSRRPPDDWDAVEQLRRLA